jgi:hypothetical protein
MKNVEQKMSIGSLNDGVVCIDNANIGIKKRSFKISSTDLFRQKRNIQKVWTSNMRVSRACPEGVQRVSRGCPEGVQRVSRGM